MSHSFKKTRSFSLSEAYFAMFNAIRMVPTLRRTRHQKDVSEAFKERVMLAVTQVNGCALCSYAHTKMALESGMELNEVRQLLSGSFEDAPECELPAVLFAQHYAESRGRASAKSWETLVNTYGKEQALILLSYIRMIMAGNAYGMPMGSLKGRLKRQKEWIDPRSNVWYEAAMVLSSLLSAPVGCVHALVFALLKQPLVDFKDVE